MRSLEKGTDVIELLSFAVVVLVLIIFVHKMK